MDTEDIALTKKALSQNRRFRKVTQQLSNEVAQKYQITYTQLLTIGILKNEPGLDLNQLAARLHLSKSSVSGIVERLLHNGVIVKTKQIQDQRRLAIELTAQGKALQQATHQAFYDRLAPIVAASRAQMEAYVELQAKIIHYFEEELDEH